MENQFLVDSGALSPKALERKHQLENDPSCRTDHMAYAEGQEPISSDICGKVMREVEAYDPSAYTAADVLRALGSEHPGIAELKALLSPAAEPFLERMSQRAAAETRKHFGNTVYLFTPLYIANYCENYCVYCGFNCYNHIRRMKLSLSQIEHEMQVIADSGMEEILILTGESRAQSDVAYIGEACRLARKYFRMVGIEVYPVNVADYRYLHECGADYVTVFQETYDTEQYEKLHLSGHKRVWPYRFDAQERALMGGMRRLGAAGAVRFPARRSGKRAAYVLFAAEISAGRDFALLPAAAPDHQQREDQPAGCRGAAALPDPLRIPDLSALCGDHGLVEREQTVPRRHREDCRDEGLCRRIHRHRRPREQVHGEGERRGG